MESKSERSYSAGGIVVNPDGKVLVVNQKGTSWSLPKGHIEDGEDILNAAKREIYEESGVDQLEFIRELGTYERYKIGQHGGDDKSKLKVITMYLFRTGKNTLKPIDPENPEAKWVAKDAVAQLLTHEKDRAFFLTVIDEI